MVTVGKLLVQFRGLLSHRTHARTAGSDGPGPVRSGGIRFAPFGIAALLAALSPFDTAGPRRAAAMTPAGELASHRAVYELKLAQSRGNSSAVAARGRISTIFRQCL